MYQKLIFARDLENPSTVAYLKQHCKDGVFAVLVPRPGNVDDQYKLLKDALHPGAADVTIFFSPEKTDK